MSSRLTSAIVLGLAIVAGPMNLNAASASGLAGWAGVTDPAASKIASDIQIAVQAAINAQIDAAPLVNGKKDTAAFSKLTAAQKAALIKAAVTQVLAQADASGVSTEDQVAGLAAAVDANYITAGTAVSVAASLTPEFGVLVSSDQTIQTALKDEGLTTASTTINGQTVSIVTSLSDAANTGNTDGNSSSGSSEPTPAAYDPCAGVVAAYCG